MEGEWAPHVKYQEAVSHIQGGVLKIRGVLAEMGESVVMLAERRFPPRFEVGKGQWASPTSRLLASVAIGLNVGTEAALSLCKSIPLRRVS